MTATSKRRPAMEHISTHLLAPFDMLLEEVEKALNHVNQVGLAAYDCGDEARVSEICALAQKLEAFQEQTGGLLREWQALIAEFEPAIDEDLAVH
jgi:hypothetical protein